MLRFTGGCFISLWFANPHVRSFEGSPIGAAAVCLLPRWLALLLGATTSPDVHCILTSERQQTFWPNETYLTAAAWSSFSFVLCLCWRENGVCKVLKVEGLVGLAKCRQAMESQLKWTDLSEFLPRFCGDTFSLLWCVTVLQWYSGPVVQWSSVTGDRDIAVMCGPPRRTKRWVAEKNQGFSKNSPQFVVEIYPETYIEV